MNIDIKELPQIVDKLKSLDTDEVLYICREGISEYVIMPIEYYQSVEEIMDMFNSTASFPQVRITNPEDLELSYDEYERIKNQIMEAVERTLKPKPEKLN